MHHSGFKNIEVRWLPAPVLRGLALLCWWLAVSLTAHAQWITQTNVLRGGWNAVFLHVDPSHTTLNEMVGNDPANPIEEIWYWRPTLPTGQFVDSPQSPLGDESQWVTWIRDPLQSSALENLTGNGAYLVKVAANVSSYPWLVKGHPVIPTYRWTLSGLNFLGFPVPASPAPTFESFLAPAPALQQMGEVFRYQGGELGPTNPVRVLSLRNTPVRRDQAYWVRAGDTYNQYFCPLQVEVGGERAVHFGETMGQTKIRVRNLAHVPLTFTLRQIDSETAPVGETSIAGSLPLLLRGAVNTTNLTFGYVRLSAAPQTWNLTAAGQIGSEVELILGLNRSDMNGGPGALYAGILRFTDSLALSQVDVAASATKESTAGLWVGAAAANDVSHYLKPYAQVANDAELGALLARLQLAEGAQGFHYERDPNTGRVLVFGGPQSKTGSYLLDGPIKVDSGTVARPFPFRLIVHNDGNNSKLLQKVFTGVGLGSNAVLTTQESLLLPAKLSSARRISSVNFPISPGNVPLNFSGSIRTGGTLRVLVPLSFDDQASNPFLHTYHPDHDNLDAQFTSVLPRGIESYGVARDISLTFGAPSDDFDSLTRGSTDLSGTYRETITFEARGSANRQYQVFGSFSLKRISDIPVLTTQ